MSANEELLKRVRAVLAATPKVSEKKMFRGVTFMVNGKMSVSVSGDELMCRIDPEVYDSAVKRKGVRPMIMGGREYRGFLYVNMEALKSRKELEYWVDLCLQFNKIAKAARKTKPARKKR